MRSSLTQVDAVIFDCDGLLVDSESVWGRAEAALFAEHGFVFGTEQQAMLVGQTVEGAAVKMAAYFGLANEDEFIAAELLKRVYQEIGMLAEPLPGAVDLVRACAARVPLAVASNSPRGLLDLVLDRSGFAEFLSVSVAADEVERPKPDPEMYQKACSLLNVQPSGSVAFEDSATGVASAKAAGLYVVAVPSISGEQLGGDWQLKTLEDPCVLAWASALTITSVLTSRVVVDGNRTFAEEGSWHAIGASAPSRPWARAASSTLVLTLAPQSIQLYHTYQPVSCGTRQPSREPGCRTDRRLRARLTMASSHAKQSRCPHRGGSS